MIALVPIIILLPVSIISFIYSRKIAHPSVLISTTWIMVFSLLLAFNNIYFTLDLVPVAIISVGIFFYCISALLADFGSSKVSFKNLGNSVNLYPVNIFLFICVIMLPLYIYQQISMAGGSNNLLFAIRRSTLEGDGENLLSNFVLLSIFITIFYLIKYISDKNIKHLFLFVFAFITALVYATLTGSKSPILSLVIANGITIIMSVRKGQFLFSFIILTTAFLFLISGLFLVNYAGVSSFGTPDRVLNAALDYFLGGTVAFSTNYESIMKFDNHQTIQNAFSSIPRRLGFDIPVYTIHYPYSSISPDRVTNVYTVFFPLIKEYSILGSIIVLSIFGFLHGILYKISFRRAEVLAFYVITMSFTVTMIFGDPLLFGALTIVKYMTIGLLYSFLLFLFYRRSEKTMSKDDKESKTTYFRRTGGKI